jgi:16S rRNA (cytosine1407-C5)-methyltransferase
LPKQRKNRLPLRGTAPDPFRNEAFECYYRNLYGARWEGGSPRPGERPAGLRQSLVEEGAPAAFAEGLREPYFLDAASVLAARSLRVPAGGIILDACAAPGGKALVIAAAMPEGTRLLANELSAERRRRLAAALDRHLPEEKRVRVTVSGFDAAAQGGRKSERGRFAAILLDAPCSGERHVLADPRALGRWTPARPRFLARRQWALLSSAFLLLKPGGSLVYVTCALSEEENDGVAGRLLEKPGAVPDPPDFAEGEATRFGRIILPDRCGGMGPMYVARFYKREKSPP